MVHKSLVMSPDSGSIFKTKQLENIYKEFLCAYCLYFCVAIDCLFLLQINPFSSREWMKQLEGRRPNLM